MDATITIPRLTHPTPAEANAIADALLGGIAYLAITDDVVYTTTLPTGKEVTVEVKR